MKKQKPTKKLMSLIMAFTLMLTLIPAGIVMVNALGDAYSIISVGRNHTMAIKSDGSLWAWGINGNGQLGDGTTEDRHTPVKIMDGVVQVSAGYNHTLAVKSDGSLWEWGQFLGGVGVPEDFTTDDRLVPAKIMDGVTQVSAGDFHCVAMKGMVASGFGEIMAVDNTGLAHMRAVIPR